MAEYKETSLETVATSETVALLQRSLAISALSDTLDQLRGSVNELTTEQIEHISTILGAIAIQEQNPDKEIVRDYTERQRPDLTPEEERILGRHVTFLSKVYGDDFIAIFEQLGLQESTLIIMKLKDMYLSNNTSDNPEINASRLERFAYGMSDAESGMAVEGKSSNFAPKQARITIVNQLKRHYTDSDTIKVLVDVLVNSSIDLDTASITTLRRKVHQNDNEAYSLEQSPDAITDMEQTFALPAHVTFLTKLYGTTMTDVIEGMTSHQAASLIRKLNNLYIASTENVIADKYSEQLKNFANGMSDEENFAVQRTGKGGNSVFYSREVIIRKLKKFPTIDLVDLLFEALSDAEPSGEPSTDPIELYLPQEHITFFEKIYDEDVHERIYQMSAAQSAVLIHRLKALYVKDNPSSHSEVHAARLESFARIVSRKRLMQSHGLGRNTVIESRAIIARDLRERYDESVLILTLLEVLNAPPESEDLTQEIPQVHINFLERIYGEEMHEEISALTIAQSSTIIRALNKLHKSENLSGKSTAAFSSRLDRFASGLSDVQTSRLEGVDRANIGVSRIRVAEALLAHYKEDELKKVFYDTVNENHQSRSTLFKLETRLQAFGKNVGMNTQAQEALLAKIKGEEIHESASHALKQALQLVRKQYFMIDTDILTGIEESVVRLMIGMGTNTENISDQLDRMYGEETDYDYREIVINLLNKLGTHSRSKAA
jgi:hypothetical protein